MTRRKALLAVMSGTVGMLSGRTVFSNEKDTTIQGYTGHGFYPELYNPKRVIWFMDDITIVELRLGKEKIELSTKEIFEALK